MHFHSRRRLRYSGLSLSAIDLRVAVVERIQLMAELEACDVLKVFTALRGR